MTKNKLRWIQDPNNSDRFKLLDINNRILIIIDYSYEYDNNYYYYEIYDCAGSGILTDLFYKLRNADCCGHELEIREFETLESIKEYVENKINIWVKDNF